MGNSAINDPTARQWFTECLNMESSQVMLIPCTDKSSQKSLKTKLYMIRRYYATNYDADEAEKLTFSLVTKEGQFYIQAFKRPSSCRVGWKISADGTREKVALPNPGQRARQIRVLKEEGKSIPEIEEEIGFLSPEEITIYNNHIIE